jgi:hypothetical protein
VKRGEWNRTVKGVGKKNFSRSGIIQTEGFEKTQRVLGLHSAHPLNLNASIYIWSVYFFCVIFAFLVNFCYNKSMKFLGRRNGVFLCITLIISLCSVFYVGFNYYPGVLTLMSAHVVSTVNAPDSLPTTTDSVPAIPLPQKLENPPNIIKAVYITGWSAGSKKYLAYLDALFKATQTNAVVVDIKDYSGMVSYATGAQKAKEYKAYYAQIADINALINHLHAQNIYVIGRVVVFEDPVLARNRPDLAIYDKLKTKEVTKPIVWENNDSLAWVDPASQEVWDYNIAIAQDAASHGFDEINFDYVRFPTDGNEDAMGFPVWNQKTPKNFIIKDFFAKVRSSLPDTKISVDIFGQVTTNTDDLGIGQVFENSLRYFDYVCPMVYPSHYITGFLGYKNPADHPYEIIKYALDTALARQKVFEMGLPRSHARGLRQTRLCRWG